MSDTKSKATIFSKMAKVMGELQRIPKSGYNQQQRYNFATAEDVKDVVRKAFAAHNLALLVGLADYEAMEIKSAKGTVGTKIRGNIEYTIACGDTGETITRCLPTEAEDYQDKVFSKLYTIGLKYFLIDTFMISTGDEDDPDKDGGSEKVQQRPTNGRKWPPRPWPPETLREYIQHKISQDSYTGKPSEKQLQFAASSLADIVNRDEDARHRLTDYLLGKWSLEEISGSEASTLIAWIGASKANDYQPNPDSVIEAKAVISIEPVAE